MDGDAPARPFERVLHEVARHLVEILRLAGDSKVVRHIDRQRDLPLGMDLGEDITEVSNPRRDQRSAFAPDR